MTTHGLQSMTILFVITMCILTSCNKDDDAPNPNAPSILYFNSFENPDDLIGVDGNAFLLSGEIPLQGGDSSLLVSGGCVGPHFNLDLGPFDTDKKLTMNFMGRAEYLNCGSVTLRAMKAHAWIDVILTDSTWTYYQSQDTLFLPEDETLRIEITSGGLFACNSFIDLLTIVEHEP